jgi:cell division protein FtsQ
MSKNKRRKGIFKWFILVSLLAYVVTMGAWASQRKATMPCRDVLVEVNGNGMLATATRNGVLAHIASYGSFKGKRECDINIRNIEARLSRLSNLEKVECAFDASGNLVVRVTPLIPEMRVFTSKGGSYYVNKDGKRMDAAAEFFTEVPVVYGDFRGKFKPQNLLPVLRAIAADPRMKSLTTMIKVADNNDIIIVPRITGHVINIGDTTMLANKFRRLIAFYDKVMDYKGWNTYDTISVKFRNQVVATRAYKGALYTEVQDTLGEQIEEDALMGANLQNDIHDNINSKKQKNP